MNQVEINRAFDANDVANQAAEHILDRLVGAEGIFNICLTGGTVGILTLKVLAEKERIRDVDFSDIHVWFGDERFVAHDSPDRNALQARKALLDGIDIPAQNIHELPASDKYTNLELAAAEFEKYMLNHFDGKPPAMDLMILGMGPDGHVASLFPGHSYPERLIVWESNSPKPPSERISMSYELINSSTEILFVVSGLDKADAVEKVHKDSLCDLPAAKIEAREQTLWIIDQAAGAAFWSC